MFEWFLDYLIGTLKMYPFKSSYRHFFDKFKPNRFSDNKSSGTVLKKKKIPIQRYVLLAPLCTDTVTQVKRINVETNTDSSFSFFCCKILFTIINYMLHSNCLNRFTEKCFKERYGFVFLVTIITNAFCKSIPYLYS